MLEYIRWALCDQQSDPSTDQGAVGAQPKRRDLVGNTLANVSGIVEVGYVLNDVLHVVRRRSESGELQIKIGASDYRTCTEHEVRRLLRVQAYSQKQLSGVGVQVSELVRFVHGPIEPQLTEIAARVADIVGRLHSTHARLEQHLRNRRDLAQAELEVASLDAQHAKLMSALSGLSVDQADVFVAQTGIERDGEELDALVLRKQRVYSAIEELLDGLPDSVSPNELERIRSSTVRDATAALSGFAEQVRESLAQYRAGGVAAKYLDSTLARAKSQLDGVLSEHRTKYDHARKTADENARLLTELENVERRRARARSMVEGLNRSVHDGDSAHAVFHGTREELALIAQERSELVRTQCNRLTELSGGLLRAELRQGARMDQPDDMLRAALRGKGIKTDRYDTLFGILKRADNPTVEWHAVQDEIAALREAAYGVDAELPRLPSTPIIESAGFSYKDRQVLARTITSTAWLSMVVAIPSDEPVFMYESREGEYISFSDASAGQQATALLRVLLSEDGPPLIVDQPEDDLDNRVVQEIVQEIWKAKCRRQLIFSSHNANLVVNGDAELVIVFDYRVAGDQSGGKIKVEGAIDIPRINTEIANIMEGGKDAFARRRAKYGF